VVYILTIKWCGIQNVRFLAPRKTQCNSVTKISGLRFWGNNRCLMWGQNLNGPHLNWIVHAYLPPHKFAWWPCRCCLSQTCTFPTRGSTLWHSDDTDFHENLIITFYLITEFVFETWSTYSLWLLHRSCFNVKKSLHYPQNGLCVSYFNVDGQSVAKQRLGKQTSTIRKLFSMRSAPSKITEM
jgi:hypothetical protein